MRSKELKAGVLLVLFLFGFAAVIAWHSRAPGALFQAHAPIFWLLLVSASISYGTWIAFRRPASWQAKFAIRSGLVLFFCVLGAYLWKGLSS